MAQAIQRERKITLAINVPRVEDLPDAAAYVGMFLDTLDTDDEYDVDLHVGVNAENEPQKPPIGFTADAQGHGIEIDEEEPDGEHLN